MKRNIANSNNMYVVKRHSINSSLNKLFDEGMKQ